MNINNNPKSPQQKQTGPRFNLTWLYLLIIVALGFIYFSSNGVSSAQTTTYTQFQQYVEKGYVEKVEANKPDGPLTAYIKNQNIRDVFGQTPQNVPDPKLSVQTPSLENVQAFLEAQQQQGHFKGTIDYKKENNILTNLLWNIGPLVLLVIVWLYFMRKMSPGAGGGGGIFSVGRSKAKIYDKGNQMKVTFKDVAGQDGAKQEVSEIVEFLKDPTKYTRLGGKIPKGALLIGPPGTGKTLLAKAVAGEAGVPFFSLSGSDFVEMFVGVGASRVRDLFRQAKEKAPCIIFIDEIDAIGRSRTKSPAMGGNDERENTLNQLLTEMDGFGTNSGVIILAATNRADILDKALLRAGRFDRQIHVDLPDLNERKAIFEVHLRPIKTDNTVDVDLLARQTPGFSGADIANVCNEAALIAARYNKASVSKDDFLSAVDRIVGGLEKKTKVMTLEEKRVIAIHEAGHATISWLLEYANPLIKVSIVPRGVSLGAAWYLPEERQITTKEMMLDEICALLGGRAAEELFTGHIGTGAMNDLERATKQIYGMIAYAGMSEKLPNLCYYNNDEYSFNKPYSDETAQLIDSEALRLMNEQYERAKDILRKHAEGHHRLAKELIDKEVVYSEDVEKIFGKRPWISRTEEILSDEKEEEAKKKLQANRTASATNGTETPQTTASTAANDVPESASPTESASDKTAESNKETPQAAAPNEDKN